MYGIVVVFTYFDGFYRRWFDIGLCTGTWCVPRHQETGDWGDNRIRLSWVLEMSLLPKDGNPGHPKSGLQRVTRVTKM